MASFDFRVYQQQSRWHFTILQLMEDQAGASLPIYESMAEHRQGYSTEEEAKTAAIEYKKSLS